jgi:putative addiction module component (TIGR02574 family)
LHPTQKEIDELWAQEVEKRFNDIRTGKVKPVTADEVFGEIQKIYNK